MVCEVSALVEALKFFSGVVGKEGPYYFNCNVVGHGGWSEKMEDGVDYDTYQIGEVGEPVTMDQILTTLKAVARNKLLDDAYMCGRSFFHEGYYVSSDGKTLNMQWGS